MAIDDRTGTDEGAIDPSVAADAQELTQASETERSVGGSRSCVA